MSIPNNHENPCYNEAQQAAGREMSKAELDEMFGRLEKEAGRYMKQGLSPQEALQKAGAKMADAERLAGIIRANQEKLNFIAQIRLRKQNGPGASLRRGGQSGAAFRAVRAAGGGYGRAL